jgi:hypothetical protein
LCLLQEPQVIRLVSFYTSRDAKTGVSDATISEYG